MLFDKSFAWQKSILQKKTSHEPVLKKSIVIAYEKLFMHLRCSYFLWKKSHSPNRMIRRMAVFGRNGEIWTRDLFHPKEARYQAAPRPVNYRPLSCRPFNSNRFKDTCQGIIFLTSMITTFHFWIICRFYVLTLFPIKNKRFTSIYATRNGYM